MFLFEPSWNFEAPEFDKKHLKKVKGTTGWNIVYIIIMMNTSLNTLVIYWPSTEPSIKRYTYVNKQKNSGSRWALNNNITRCTDSSSQLGIRCRSESQRQTEGFGLSVTHGWATPAKMKKKCCYGQKNLSQYCSLSPSPTHLSHTRNINPFENKVWEIYFYKEVYSFVHWSSSLLLTMFLHIFVLQYTTL